MLSNEKISRALARILPFLTYGLSDNMTLLVDHFTPYLDLDAFDQDGAQVRMKFFIHA